MVNTESTKTGFECQFVEQPKELQFECPVCLCVLREPHRTTCCDHSFCRGCIEPIKASNRAVCPLCKQKFEIHPSKWLQRSLYHLDVYCVHKSEGCEWVGPLGQLEKHLNHATDAAGDELMNGCGFVPLRCHSCGESVPRKGFKEHVSDVCEQRPFDCEFCDEYKSTYLDVVDNHWPQCPCHPVECTNKCGKSIKRKDLEQHFSRECPLTSIPCEFCSIPVAREKMHDHLVSNLTTHVALMIDNKLDALSHQVHEAERKIRKLTHENQCLQEELHLHVKKSKEGICRIEAENLKTQTLCSEIQQQNVELTRKYGSLQKEYDDLKLELHDRARQLSSDIADLKWIEKEKKIANPEARSEFGYTSMGAGNTQASVHSTSTYATHYDEFNSTSFFGLSQASASLTGYLQDFEMPDRQHNPSIEGPPVTLIMTNYSSYSSGPKSGQYWVSRPFYSDTQPSYKLCLSVRASGNLSVYVRLVRGEFDSQLVWPFNANITIKLKNHCRGRNWGRKITFKNGHRVTKGTIAHGGRGDGNFITLYENSSFVKDNALWFEVVSVQLV